VSGEVKKVSAKPNIRVSAGTVLFEIDPAPYEFKVAQLKRLLPKPNNRFFSWAQATNSRLRMSLDWKHSSSFITSGLRM
jgi:multidrug resistance efflux pump